MATATFDTLSTARALEDAGMDPAQAVAVTEAINGAVGGADTATRADLATLRADLKRDQATLRADLRAELKRDQATLRADLRADLQALETRLTWRMFLMMGGLLALATAMNRLFG